MKRVLIVLLFISVLFTCGCINKSATGEIVKKETTTTNPTTSSTTSTIRKTYTTITTSTSTTISTTLPTTTSSSTTSTSTSTTTTADRGGTTSTSTITSSISSTTTTFSTTTTILHCSGTFNATVDYVKDGDSLRVKECEKDIRLALTDAYEWYESGGGEAKEFTKNLCKKGYKITVDEDSGQIGKDRIIALVYCQGKKLNAELLYEGLAIIDTRFCDKSEFSDEDWAQEYGC